MAFPPTPDAVLVRAGGHGVSAALRGAMAGRSVPLLEKD